MTVRLPFCRFLAIFIFFTFSPISLVFINRFSKNFQLKISKLNIPSFEKNNNDRQSHSRKFVLRYLWMLSSLFISKIRKLDKTSQGKAPRGQGRSRQFIYKQLCFYAYYTFKYSIMFMSIFVLLSIYKTRMTTSIKAKH